MKRGLLYSIMLVSACMGSISSHAANLAECKTIADNMARLSCYDALPATADSPAAMETPDTLLVGTAVEAGAGEADTTLSATPMRKRIALEKAHAGRQWIITPHRRNYILPVTYNSNIHEEVWTDIFPDANMDDIEAKFQISFKFLLWEDILGENTNLWAA
jgi:phospholipase A1